MLNTLARVALIALAVGVFLAHPALAQSTTVDVGTPLTNLLATYVTLVGTILAALVGWAVLKFTGVKLDSEARAAIEAFANNMAGKFLADLDSLKGIKIDVKNPTIAMLAMEALDRIPGALARFGLGVEDVRHRIVEKIGVLTAADPDPVPPVVVLQPSA